MDRGSSSKVEATEDKGPAVGVPCPASDGVVDDGGPDEDEDKDGAKATTLSDGTDSKGSTRSALISTREWRFHLNLRYASKHALVDHEQQ